MDYKGSSVYDNEDFFYHYLLRRNRADSPNNMIEKPVIYDLMGDILGKKVLDLGCGDAKFGYELLEQGCIFYEGVEGSSNMVKAAKELLNTSKSKINHASMESWNYPKEKYDLVISRLAIHYLQDLEPIFDSIRSALIPNGQFIFSVQHPVLTSSMKSATTSERKSDWIVDNYFEMGKRMEPWIGESVVKYHRTFEEYFQSLKHVGFKIEDIRECEPNPQFFNSEGEYKRRMRIPLFLVFKCIK